MLSGASLQTNNMTLAQTSVIELTSVEQFFDNSTGELTEDLSGFTPTPDMMTAAQQVAHAAQIIDWFVEGAFRPEGFDLTAHERRHERDLSRNGARMVRQIPRQRQNYPRIQIG